MQECDLLSITLMHCEDARLCPCVRNCAMLMGEGNCALENAIVCSIQALLASSEVE